MDTTRDDKFTLVQPIRIPFGAYEILISNICLMYRNSLSFDHWHDEYELHYVVKGDSTFVVNNTKYEVKQGEICWINPGANRHVDTNPEDEHIHFIVHFSFRKRQVQTSSILIDSEDVAQVVKYLEQKQVWIGEAKNRYHSLCSLIRKELEEKKFGHMIVVRNMICSFIVCCIQNLEVPCLEDSAYWSAQDNITHSIISYIRNHYSEYITLSTAASELKVSERHITRLLREKYGTTFNATLLSFRISHVQEYLLKTDLSLEQIAEKTGFSSPQLMSSNFKKLTGQTIKQYRDSIRKF